MNDANVMLAAPPAIEAEIQFLERRHAEVPEGRFWVPLADRLRRVGNLDRAESLLKQGLEAFPNSISARVVLGQCLADLGRNDEAREQFRGVLDSDPQNLVALRALGALANSEGDIQEAARWYRALLAVDPMNEDAHSALAVLEAPPAEPAAPAEIPEITTEPEEFAEAAEGDAAAEVEVVTETIAELYSQQGLHGHAAEVYRQLLHTRGEDPELRRRLERAERLAAPEPTIGASLQALLSWQPRSPR